MDRKAFEILSSQGVIACMAYCIAERDEAQATGYVGAVEYWQGQLDRLVR